jgi:glycosyltransferase involved in cell wall biosynthesis
VPPGDPIGLAQAIRELLGDEAKRRAMSEAARPSIERFRWERVAGEMLSMHLSLVGRKT